MIKSQKGFNLVELLVAISIFGILATIVTANIRGGSSGRELDLQAENITSLLRDAQVRSLSGQPEGGQVPSGGYGVHLDVCTTPPCSVTLFADSDADFTFDASEEISVQSLGSVVTIPTLSTGTSMDVLFKPPRPFICFSDECSGVGQGTITVGNTSSSATKTITVDQVSGRISS